MECEKRRREREHESYILHLLCHRGVRGGDCYTLRPTPSQGLFHVDTQNVLGSANNGNLPS